MLTSTLPYEPRALTLKELKAVDTYLFYSPKMQRNASVVDPVRLAIWLDHEFNPSTVAIIERPRTITLADDREVEIDFWYRSSDGRERFQVVVAVADTSVVSGRPVNRQLKSWDRSAQLAGIELDFIYEHAWEHRVTPFSNHLRLLPHVQAFRACLLPEGRHYDRFNRAQTAVGAIIQQNASVFSSASLHW